MPPQRIVQIIKSITAREIFKQRPEVKQQLWGGEFWTKGYFINTVGRSTTENAVKQYVKSQGRASEYHVLHHDQPTLFDH